MGRGPRNSHPAQAAGKPAAPVPSPRQQAEAAANARPSIQVLFGIFEREYDRGVAHFRALDAKAGVLLAFDGAIVALGKDLPTPWRALSVGFAVLSGLAGLTAFWPKAISALDLTRAADYAAAQPGHTMHEMGHKFREHHEANRESARRKGVSIKVSIVLLSLSALMYGLGTINPHFENGGTSHGGQQPRPAATERSSPGAAGGASASTAPVPRRADPSASHS